MYRNHLSPAVFPYSWASDWGEDQYGLWMAFTYQKVRHVFRWIPPGSFLMGSPADEKGRYKNEDQHQVRLTSGFWLAETTVTQELWQAVMQKNPSRFKAAQRPVEQVSWDDCIAFIEQLNQRIPELNARLPWEAQWEYAGRAGTISPFNFGNELSLDRVNYNGYWDQWEFAEDAKQETALVKSYPCNDWGLYEMHGNVWEWCEDVWQEHLGRELLIDPWKQQTIPRAGDVHRVVRGGSWNNGGRYVRSAIRGRGAPDDRNDSLGFRLSLGH